MLKSCSYCGRIHDTKEICSAKKAADSRRWKNRKQSKANSFRHTNAWTQKSIQVRQRDRYMCVCCMANLPGTVKQFNTTDLSVHHIEPIEEAYDKRLDSDNLITVCAVHHELCEAGEITRDVQHMLADKENEKI